MLSIKNLESLIEGNRKKIHAWQLEISVWQHEIDAFRLVEYKEKYGAEVGVHATSSRFDGRRFLITVVDPRETSSRPLVKGRLYNKDGMLSKREHDFYNHWELEKEKEKEK